MSEKLVIKEIEKTCESYPAQWEGKTEGGKSIYIRYRGGWLTVNLSLLPSDSISDAIRGEEIFSRQLGHEFHGCLSYKDLKKAVGKFIQLPEADSVLAKGKEK